MQNMVLREDKISLLRRLFGVTFLSIAFLIALLLEDYFKCSYGFVSCQQGMGNTDIWSTPLPVGIFFVTVLTISGLFFGFFSGKQTVHGGHLNLENFLMGIRIRRSSLAKLADYSEVRVTKKKGFGQMTYHAIRVAERDVWHVQLVGSDAVTVGYFQDEEIARPYVEKLVSASGLPLKEIVI
ncbi:hypothetical protein OAK75_00865 [Bacteriovoracales bacterium]|nr:hypothetical protein [Bacteriovoracales bacterium]